MTSALHVLLGIGIEKKKLSQFFTPLLVVIYAVKEVSRIKHVVGPTMVVQALSTHPKIITC